VAVAIDPRPGMAVDMGASSGNAANRGGAVEGGRRRLPATWSSPNEYCLPNDQARNALYMGPLTLVSRSAGP